MSACKKCKLMIENFDSALINYLMKHLIENGRSKECLALPTG